MELTDICNNNQMNMVEQNIYDAFNTLMFSSDLKVIGKLLHRFEYFLKVKDLPGDIVEIGVFKGSGVATFMKFIQLYCPNSNKKVIGFDIFNVVEAKEALEKDSDIDKETMSVVYDKVNHNDLTWESVLGRLGGLGKDESIFDKFELVSGDVEETLPKYNKDNPGFRASLIYIDVDLDRPTYAALTHLWDRLLPGGIILFDEYEYHKFSESNGVERFLKERNIEYNLQSTNWIAPTAFILKKGF